MSRIRTASCSSLFVVLFLLFGEFATSVAGAQTITEFVTSNSGPNRITVGPDGALWFTEWFGRIGRITTEGVMTEFSLPLEPGLIAPWGLASIAVGPDGNLWFTNSLSNRIGRITTAGEITEFDIPWTPVPCGFLCVKGEPQPVGITAGPDGNLWFTEGLGRIGRITTAGSVTGDFPIPTLGSQPSHIIAGQDGALWFDDRDKIGRISMDGVITEFASPIRDSSGLAYIVGSITAGPDGALWYTAGSSIGRITYAGVITEFALPTAVVSNSIAAGPDGNLWFTNGNQIGRITTAGAFIEFPVFLTSPANYNYIPDITSGPDGALWFTESSPGKIGRITTSAATPVPVPAPIGWRPGVVPFR